MTVIRHLGRLSNRDEALAAAAVAAAACGALSAAPLPTILRASALLAFMLGGVGSAVMCWIDLPIAVTIAAVVGLSIATLMAVAVTMAWLQFWHPVPSCLILAGVVAASGTVRLCTSGDPTGNVGATW